MATLYISEYASIGGIGNFPVQSPLEPSVTSQTVAIAGTSAQSSTFNDNTNFVRLHTDAICSVKFGADPTAAATDARMAVNQTEYFAVHPGHKVAVITNT